jgi:hypothetical protein
MRMKIRRCDREIKRCEKSTGTRERKGERKRERRGKEGRCVCI